MLCGSLPSLRRYCESRCVVSASPRTLLSIPSLPLEAVSGTSPLPRPSRLAPSQPFAWLDSWHAPQAKQLIVLRALAPPRFPFFPNPVSRWLSAHSHNCHLLAVRLARVYPCVFHRDRLRGFQRVTGLHIKRTGKCFRLCVSMFLFCFFTTGGGHHTLPPPPPSLPPSGFLFFLRHVNLFFALSFVFNCFVTHCTQGSDRETWRSSALCVLSATLWCSWTGQSVPRVCGFLT